MSYKIVVARYNENIEWLNAEMEHCIIYNKGDRLYLNNEIMLKNVGRESETYLQYIIQNYSNLPDVVVFTQAQISDHRGVDDVNHLIRLKHEALFYSKSQPSYKHYDIGESIDWDKKWNVRDGSYFSYNNYKNNHLVSYYAWFIKNINPKYPTPLKIYTNGIFAVRKEHILFMPIEYYKKLILEVNYSDNPVEGHFFERSWYYIFMNGYYMNRPDNDRLYMLKIIENIPNINIYPLTHVFEHMKFKHKPNTLWLEFGVSTGRTINYISQFTTREVYGFDSFEGLPEKWRDGFDKGVFDQDGEPPIVKDNVKLIKGWFNETLPGFIKTHNKKVSFIHMDADLYSSTKCIFDNIKDYIDNDCIIIFDELVNYPGFDGETGELKAFYEFITENNVNYEWIGMNGTPIGMRGYHHENVAVIIHSIRPL